MGTVAPLIIIQARYHATRLPGKMLAMLGNETLIARAWRLASGIAQTVVAVPAADFYTPLQSELVAIGATVFCWNGPEADVLSRFHHCAHAYRWHPQSVIVRWTPDDPFKDRNAVHHTIAGGRHPVEIGCEAFTLATLDRAFHTTAEDDYGPREHLGNHRQLFPFPPLVCPPGAGWTVDTEADLEAARARLAREPESWPREPYVGIEL